jgi:hypothetical protein
MRLEQELQSWQIFLADGIGSWFKDRLREIYGVMTR